MILGHEFSLSAYKLRPGDGCTKSVGEALLVDLDKSLVHQTVKEALHATVKRMLVSAVQGKDDLADRGAVLSLPENL